MKYRKKPIISSRVDSKWLSALNRKEGTPPSLAHEWADQGDVGLFVNPDTRGPQLPLRAQAIAQAPAGFIDRETIAIAQAMVGAALFIAGIAVGKLL